MKIQRTIWLFVMVGLFVPSQLVYADKCDDIFAKAAGIFDSAREAANQKNYDRAAELYEEAAKYYDKVANIPKCRCPKIHKASRNNVRISRENASKWRKWIKEYAAEVELTEEYNHPKKDITKEIPMPETDNGIKPLPLLKTPPKYGTALVPRPKVKMARGL